MRVLFETVWGGPQTDVLDFDGKIELVFPSTNFFPSSKGTIFLLNFEGEKNYIFFFFYIFGNILTNFDGGK